MHSIEVINEKLSKLQPLNYNQFFWWRRWTTKNKPLDKFAPLLDRIQNGDFEFSHYFWQWQYCEWEISEVEKKCGVDGQKWVELTQVDRARRKRLFADFEKDENEKLQSLKKLFLQNFKMSDDQYEQELSEFGGTIEDFYHYCEEKYKKYNIIQNKPRRGRPPKIKK